MFQMFSRKNLGRSVSNHVLFFDLQYSILMYVSQQQKITTAKITPAFSYTVRLLYSIIDDLNILHLIINECNPFIWH